MVEYFQRSNQHNQAILAQSLSYPQSSEKAQNHTRRTISQAPGETSLKDALR